MKIKTKGTPQPSQEARSTATSTTTATPNTQSTVPPVQQNPLDALGGLGGLGGFGAMGGGLNNPYGTNPGGVNLMELLNNPTFMQYISQMVQDPRFIEQMVAMNPQLASMRQMFQDPEIQALMSNPDMLRNMAALSSMMGPGPFAGGGLGSQTAATTTQPSTNRSTTTTATTGTTPSSTAPNTTPNTSASPNPLLDFLNNPALTGAANPNSTQPSMQFDPSLFFGTPAAPQQPPEERFQVQLQQLNEMGFWDAQKKYQGIVSLRRKC